MNILSWVIGTAILLAQIVGFSETLERDWAEISDDELRRYLQVMARNGRKMSRIIAETLPKPHG